MDKYLSVEGWGMKTLVLFWELDFSRYTKFILVQSLINGIKYLWPKAEAIEKEPRMKKNLNFYWNQLRKNTMIFNINALLILLTRNRNLTE